MKKPYTLLAIPMLRNSLLALFLLLICTSAVFAQENQHMLPISLEERVQQASLIVEGEVISQKSFWDTNRNNIYTSHIIKVFKVFKGQIQGQQLEVITEGGTVGLSKHVWSTSLKLTKEQQGLFFLQDQQELRYTPATGARSTKAYGSQQGMIMYDIRHNKAADAFNTYSSIQSIYSTIANHTKQKFRVVEKNNKLQQATLIQSQKQAALAPVITSFSPAVASAGTNTVLTITGTGFGNTRGDGSVEFKNADDGGQTYIEPLPTDYISWSDTQIRVYVPGTSEESSPAGTGLIRVTTDDGATYTSASELLIPFVYSNVSYESGETGGGIKYEAGTAQPLLQDKNNTGGYTIQYAPSLLNNNAAVDGFQRAVTSWTCATGINWKVGEPVASDVIADDDRNVITFTSSDIGERVLASTISRYEGYLCGNNNEIVFFLKEFDMQINSKINWQYGPGAPVNRQYDYETVILHELGHAHQLGHVIRPRLAVMHYSVEFERTYRILSEADIAGGNLIVARSSVQNICNIDPMEPIPANACRLFPNVAGLTLAFNATGNAVEVKWISTDETGVVGYTVERSSNGIDYEEVGNVSPTGNNSTYTFIDQSPLAYKSFYRIKVIYGDNNQLPRFSTERSVVNPEDLNEIIVTPNPVDEEGTTRVIYLTTTNTEVTFYLYDSVGKLHLQTKATFTETDSEIELDLDGLAGGIYFLRWNTPRDSGTEKILKL